MRKTSLLKIQRKTALDYLHEYGGKLTKDEELMLSAENVLLRVKRSGGNPLGLAAGVLFNVCKTRKAKITKERIGEAFHISARTVYTNENRIQKTFERKAVGSRGFFG